MYAVFAKTVIFLTLRGVLNYVHFFIIIYTMPKFVIINHRKCVYVFFCFHANALNFHGDIEG